jgi:flagellar basal-body rod modification protein FlgD
MPIPAILATVAGGLVSSLVQSAFGSSGQTAATTQTSSSQSLNKDDFLRLLMAQLRNQDPMNPVNNTEFVAQTAQFSSLEQLQNINTTLGGLASQVGGMGTASAASFLGKIATINGSPLTLDGSTPATVAYALPASAASVVVRVQDEAGKVVRTVILGQQGQGVHQIVFDGLGDDGRQLPSGSYTYQVAAADSAGRLVPGVYTGAGTVTGVTVESGSLKLLLGQQSVPLTSVVGVMANTTL